MVVKNGITFVLGLYVWSYINFVLCVAVSSVRRPTVTR